MRPSNRSANLGVDPTAGHPSVLGFRHPGVAQVVGANPGRQTFVVDQRLRRLAERVRRHVRHAELVTHLVPTGAEVVAVAPDTIDNVQWLCCACDAIKTQGERTAGIRHFYGQRNRDVERHPGML